MSDNIPTIDAYLYPGRGKEKGNWYAVCGPCPYCDSWHFHGGAAGHRASHCYTPSRNSGYELIIVGEAPSGLLEAVEDYRYAKRLDRREKTKAAIQRLLEPTKLRACI